MEQLNSFEDQASDYLIEVDKGQSPLRIDKFLMEKIENATRSRIQYALKIGAIKVNATEVKPNYKVRPLDRISVLMPKPEDYISEVKAEDIPLNVVYEDEVILVVNKPAGMVVHPGVGNYTGTLVNALAHYFQNSSDLPIKDGNPNNRPGLVHRIDKETSGLLVIAKTEEAMTHLAKQFADHTSERTYWALCWGDVPEAGTIDKPIGRHPKNRLQMHAFMEEQEGSKHAVTHFRCLENMYYVSLVECKLETGRTHQIRVHMMSEGFPVFSDQRYGGNRVVKGTVFTKYKQFVDNCFRLMPRQALHAKTLGFEHPQSGEWMSFESELPEDFSSVLEKWRNYLKSRKEKNEPEN